MCTPEETSAEINERIFHGDCLLRQGLYFEALRCWHDALEGLPPESPLRIKILGRMARARRRRHWSRGLMITAVLLSLVVVLGWGITSYRREKDQQKKSQAQELYQKFHNRLRKGHLKQAQKIYATLKTLHPKSSYVTKAADELEEMVDFYTRSQTYFDKANKLVRGQGYQKACETLDKLLQEKNSDPKIIRQAREAKLKARWAAWLRQSAIKLKQQDLVGALEALKQANRLAPEIGEAPRPLDKLTKMLEQKNALTCKLRLFEGQKALYQQQWEQARKALQDAVRLAPDNKLATQLYHLAQQGLFPPGMVFIPQGPFLMGGIRSADELPPHIVTLEPYFIDRYEVSCEDYARFVQATGHRPPPDWNSKLPLQPRLPVTNVSWYDARAYARWAGKQLPSEAQWEKAARGYYPDSPQGFKLPQLPPVEKFIQLARQLSNAKALSNKADKLALQLPRVYPWGNYWDADLVTSKRAPVDSYPQGRSFFGLHHMAGNVWEWVADWYEPYDDRLGCAYFGKKFKVIRGGSWHSAPEDLRTANRSAYQPEAYFPDVGFRCVRLLKESR